MLMFCLNMEVYRVNTTNTRVVSQTDQICICTTNHVLFFLEADSIFAGYRQFKEETRMPRTQGYQLGFSPTQILWDGDYIYIASKRAYMVMSYNDGAILTKCEIDQRETPMMAVLQEQLLIVTGLGKKAHFFDKTEGIKTDRIFNLDGAGPVVSIQLVNEYVIAVFELCVRVYKAATGDFL